jgi:hypothetical protein
MPGPRKTRFTGQAGRPRAASVPVMLGLLASAFAGLLLAALPSPGAAQSGTAVYNPPPPPVDLDLGFDTRVRQVTIHNLLDFDSDGASGFPSDAAFFRVRHRILADLKFRPGFELKTRFTTEWRKYLDPWVTPEKTEIILDNFYLNIPQVADLPLGLRIGRQDIIRGEGFVLLEGGPNDGSRSIYHNAVLVMLDGDALGLRRAKIDLFAIRNPAYDDFVVANDLERPIVGKDETAFGVYLTQPVPMVGKNESYYIYKEEEPESAPEPDTKLHTLGTRSSGDLPWDLRFGLEAAYQFGEHADPADGKKLSDHRAFGGYLWVSRNFLTLLHPSIKLGAFYLSGDDPDSDDNQGWNPLFSRWPKWSELYIYSQINEQNGVAYWTNIMSLNAQVGLKLSGAVGATYTFHHFTAPERSGLPPARRGSGDTRGDLHTFLVSATLSDNISAHFLAERFDPGDFYKDPLVDPLDETQGTKPKDDAYFLRWEVMFTK